MDAAAVVTEWFARVAKGDGAGALELFDDDIEYTVQGTTPLSGVYRGKASVLKDLFIPFGKLLDGDIALVPDEIICQDDTVVVRAHGRAQTRQGRAYNNSYCIVIRVRAGRILSFNEFLDTALVESAVYGRESA